jgi:hypothetical protein
VGRAPRGDNAVLGGKQERLWVTRSFEKNKKLAACFTGKRKPLKRLRSPASSPG